MGKSKNKYHKSLDEMMYQRLHDMLVDGRGRSKAEDKKTGDTEGRIYAYNTYKTYRQQGHAYTGWLAAVHPEITSWKKARKYVPEYLLSLIDERKSAYTVRTAHAALCKAFGIRPTDPDYFNPPTRQKKDIKRSRGSVDRDTHFSEASNQEFVNFCRGTGLRSSEIRALKGEDFFTREEVVTELSALQGKKESELSVEERKRLTALKDAVTNPKAEFYVFVRKGKGGKMRFAPVIGPDTDAIVERMRETRPENKVWNHIPSKADIHAYRAMYCTRMYRDLARRIRDIPYDAVNKGSGRKYQSQVYCCRKNDGRKMDKAAMIIVSKAMGHNRLDVMADHYLLGI